jgi:hypothetical protein
MKKVTARQKLLAIVAGGLIVLALVLFFGIKPFLSDLQILHSEVSSEKETLNKLLAEEASYQQARADLRRIQVRADQIESLFPTREQLVVFVERLESIAGTFENGFTISITDPEEQANLQAESRRSRAEVLEYTIVPNLRDIEVIPYSFQLEGDFLSMVQYLQSFERQQFYSEIESLQFTTSVESGLGNQQAVRTGIIEATISAAFYARKAE